MSYITVLLKKEEMRWTSFIRVLLLVNGLRSLNSIYDFVQASEEAVA